MVETHFYMWHSNNLRLG